MKTEKEVAQARLAQRAAWLKKLRGGDEVIVVADGIAQSQLNVGYTTPRLIHVADLAYDRQNGKEYVQHHQQLSSGRKQLIIEPNPENLQIWTEQQVQFGRLELIKRIRQADFTGLSIAFINDLYSAFCVEKDHYELLRRIQRDNKVVMSWRLYDDSHSEDPICNIDLMSDDNIKFSSRMEDLEITYNDLDAIKAMCEERSPENDCGTLRLVPKNLVTVPTADALHEEIKP